MKQPDSTMTGTKRNFMITTLNEKVCSVKFTKTNGEERLMECTLNMDIIPEDQHPKGDRDGKNLEVIPAWDVNAQGWRSFRVENVIDFMVSA